MFDRRAAAALCTGFLIIACSAGDDKQSETKRTAPRDTIRVVFGADSAAGPALRGTDTTDLGQAIEVVSRYYRSIDTGNLRAAYDLWADSPERLSFEEFARENESIDEIRVRTGAPGGIEGAAGSRYVEIPAVLGIVRRDGTRRKESVTHTLRKSVVDGADSVQRSWRITSSKVNQPR